MICARVRITLWIRVARSTSAAKMSLARRIPVRRVTSAKQQEVFGFASILKREGKALAYFLFAIRFGIETIGTATRGIQEFLSTPGLWCVISSSTRQNAGAAPSDRFGHMPCRLTSDEPLILFYLIFSGCASLAFCFFKIRCQFSWLMFDQAHTPALVAGNCAPWLPGLLVADRRFYAQVE